MEKYKYFDDCSSTMCPRDSGIAKTGISEAAG